MEWNTKYRKKNIDFYPDGIGSLFPLIYNEFI